MSLFLRKGYPFKASQTFLSNSVPFVKSISCVNSSLPFSKYSLSSFFIERRCVTFSKYLSRFFKIYPSKDFACKYKIQCTYGTFNSVVERLSTERPLLFHPDLLSKPQLCRHPSLMRALMPFQHIKQTLPLIVHQGR